MRLLPYIVISVIIHVLILLIPLKTGGLFTKAFIKRKREKPTLVRIIEIPEEKPEKKKVKPPKKPRILSRYTHRTEKETAPKPKPKPARPGKKAPSSTVQRRKIPRKKSAVKELLKKSKEGKYKLPPLEKLLPNPEELAKGEKPVPIPKKEEEKSIQEDLSDIVKEEKNILSLNTMEFKYISYFASIKRKIELLWSYPREAVRMGMEGKLVVKFVIGKDGSLKELKLLKSSGYKILDDEAINAIKDAAPFNPIPERLGVDHLTIIATFHYILIR